MLKVGLTGSIAVGKTFVCQVFAELGAHVLDADQTAREVVEPGTEGLSLIIEHFGEGVLLADGSLDRSKLGSIVFADESKRQLLNTLLHPLVIAKQDVWLAEQARENPTGISIIDAALMIESGGHSRFDKLIVVWCDSDIQLQRLMLRNQLTEEEALKRINAQMSQDEKKRFAGFLIDTTDGFEAARHQTAEVFEQLRIFARA